MGVNLQGQIDIIVTGFSYNSIDGSLHGVYTEGGSIILSPLVSIEEVSVMSLLEFLNVSYNNDGKTILKNLSVRINAGDFISIIGPSGSGKSTFLKLCCHLISPSEGDILYRDKSIMKYEPTTLRRQIAYVFQAPYLFGDTVMDNISFPYIIRNAKVDFERVYGLFELFNLHGEYLEKDIKKLSGGEKQRIALIRTLLFNPEIILLDEVTSSLDMENTLIVEGVIESLNQQGSTILWVTHDLEQSRKYANQVLTMENGEIKSIEVM
jgi:putative ABC transport system ATP-binding protein